MKWKTLILALGLAHLSGSPVAAADAFKTLAKELSKAAKKAGLERVAVLPFSSGDGRSSQAGWNIAEKLITHVVRRGEVQTVERSLLRQLLEEHRLAQTGVLDPANIKSLGKLLSVDGIITGSFSTSERETLIRARLIHVETGVILAASERRWEQDLLNESWLALPASTWEVEMPEQLALRDALADNPCAEAPARVDLLESYILDLKTRYWAAQLKKGGALREAKSNPGSTISDPQLKRAFYDRLKAWYHQEYVPELTPEEMKHFRRIDEKAFRIHHDCGI